MAQIPTELCQSEYRVNGGTQYTWGAKELCNVKPNAQLKLAAIRITS